MKTQRQITGRHVLIALTLFFGAVIAIDGAFTYLALKTFSGLETGQSYRTGLAYNETLEAAEEQAARGWQATLAYDPPKAGRSTMILELSDADGVPVAGLDVQGVLRRPATNAYDQPVDFQSDEDGLYRAHAPVPLSGQWDMEVTARRNGTVVHVLKERLWMR